jgi:hypothetical protein
MPGRELPPNLTGNSSVINQMNAVSDPNNLGQQDKLVGELALDVVRQEKPRIVILNLPEMDWPVAHVYGGPESPDYVRTLMENADNILGQLMAIYRAEGIYDDTVWVVMGDHGVSPLQQWVNQYEIRSAIEPSIDTVVTIDSHTSCFLWLENQQLAPLAARAVENSDASANVNAVYYLAERNGRQVYLPGPDTAERIQPGLLKAHQYLMSTMTGPNAPHIVCVFPERTGTLGAGGHGGHFWQGDHGGPAWSSQAVPLIVAGPGVKAGHISHYPARLVDVAPTAMRLLGAYYPQTDGIVLADCMDTPYPTDVTRQQVTGRYLVPAAEAIRLHSARESYRMGPIPRLHVSSTVQIGLGAEY